MDPDAPEPLARLIDETLSPWLESRPEGLYSPPFDAYVDPAQSVPRALLTHAHADHAAQGHGEILCTPETAAVYRRRNPDWSGTAREFAYGDGPRANGLALRFVSAGHVLGSSQLHFQSDGASLLYTGDFKRRRGRTAQPVDTPHAEVLMMETTFGLPVFRFPTQSELEARLVETCRETFARDAVPVILAYAFGKAQEVALILTEAGIPTVLHGAAWKLLPEYEAAGFRFPTTRAYEDGPPIRGEALIAPPRCARTPMIRNVKRRRIVYCSGWALREASRAEHDAEVLIPLSDHADFPELLDHVAGVAPRRVVTLHGFASDFARILRDRGVEAFPLPAAGERRLEETET